MLNAVTLRGSYFTQFGELTRRHRTGRDEQQIFRAQRRAGNEGEQENQRDKKLHLPARWSRTMEWTLQHKKR